MIAVAVYVHTKKFFWKKNKVAAVVRVAATLENKIAGSVEINIVGDRRIQTLNRVFRGRNQPTDVLSFAWREDPAYRGALLGQLYLAMPYIIRQAKRFSVSPPEEFVRLLTHGLLHIVGYDHDTTRKAKRMFYLQEKIVTRAYPRFIA